MKKLFVVIAAVMCSAAFAGDLRLENGRYETVAYIREDGRIEDAFFELLGHIREETENDATILRIEACDFEVLGYVRDDEAQDPNGMKLYDLTGDGRIRDNRLRNMGSIRDDGTVEGSDFRVILNTDGTQRNLKPRLLAYLVFFSTLL